MGLCSGLSGVLLLWGGVARPGSIARWRWAGLCRGDGDLNFINFYVQTTKLKMLNSFFTNYLK